MVRANRGGGVAGVKSRLGVKARIGNRLSVVDARLRLAGRPRPQPIGKHLMRTSAGIVTARKAGLSTGNAGRGAGPRPGGGRNTAGAAAVRVLDNFTIVADARGIPVAAAAQPRGLVRGQAGITRTSRGLVSPSALKLTIANERSSRRPAASVSSKTSSALRSAESRKERFDPRRVEKLQMTIANDVRAAPVAASTAASFSVSSGGVSKRLSAKAPPKNAHKVLLSNLAPSVTEADVNELCESVGRLASKARVLESGVAVAYFLRKEDAELAVGEFSGRALDGVTMNLQLMSQTPDAAPAAPSRAKASSRPAPVEAMEMEEGPAEDSPIPSAERSKFNRLLKCRDPVGGPDPDRGLVTSALFPGSSDRTKRERDANVTFTVKI